MPGLESAFDPVTKNVFLSTFFGILRTRGYVPGEYPAVDEYLLPPEDPYERILVILLLYGATREGWVAILKALFFCAHSRLCGKIDEPIPFGGHRRRLMHCAIVTGGAHVHVLVDVLTTEFRQHVNLTPRHYEWEYALVALIVEGHVKRTLPPTPVNSTRKILAQLPAAAFHAAVPGITCGRRLTALQCIGIGKDVMSSLRWLALLFERAGRFGDSIDLEVVTQCDHPSCAHNAANHKLDDDTMRAYLSYMDLRRVHRANALAQALRDAKVAFPSTFLGGILDLHVLLLTYYYEPLLPAYAVPT